MVKVGDSIPSIDLTEGSPGNKVNLAETLKGKGVIIGVPAAFSEYLSSSFPLPSASYLQKDLQEIYQNTIMFSISSM